MVGAAIVIDEGVAPHLLGGEEDAGVSSLGIEAVGEVSLAVELELARAGGDNAAGQDAVDGVSDWEGCEAFRLLGRERTGVDPGWGQDRFLGEWGWGYRCGLGGAFGGGRLAGGLPEDRSLAHMDIAAIEGADALPVDEPKSAEDDGRGRQ